MEEKTPEDREGQQQVGKLKCFCRAALVGAVAAVSGAFAYCVYDGHHRLHESWCNCAKYGALVAAAFSHPLMIVGALAGISALSIFYLVRMLYKECFRRHRKDREDENLSASP